jgi:hypothetical protein
MESNTYMVAGQTFELQHYGVKGMKWGRRKAQNTANTQKWSTKQARDEYKKLDKLKGQYKHAKKAYNRSFSYASEQSNNFSLSRVRRAEKDAAWNDAQRDAKRVNETKKAYKEQKKATRKNAPVAAKLERGARKVGVGLAAVGGMYLADQVYFGGAGTRFAKSAVTKAYTTLQDQMFDYSLLDKAGNVLKRYN